MASIVGECCVVCYCCGDFFGLTLIKSWRSLSLSNKDFHNIGGLSIMSFYFGFVVDLFYSCNA